jgi:hypothetical protein
MVWETGIIIVLVLGSILFVSRMIGRTMSGKDEICDSCPGHESCPFASVDKVTERLRERIKNGGQESESG